jgi:hypothetical protein
MTPKHRPYGHSSRHCRALAEATALVSDTTAVGADQLRYVEVSDTSSTRGHRLNSGLRNACPGEFGVRAPPRSAACGGVKRDGLV